MPSDRPPGAITAAHRRWILVNAVAVTAVVNFTLNGGIASLSAIGITRVPLWATPIVGGPSTITDTLGTLFLLPLITNLLVTTAVRRELSNRRLTQLNPAPGPPALRRLLPHTRPARGIALAAGCLVCLGPGAVAILIATNFGDVTTTTFTLYKAALGTALGALVTPVIALHAMTDTHRPATNSRSPAAHRSGSQAIRH